MSARANSRERERPASKVKHSRHDCGGKPGRVHVLATGDAATMRRVPGRLYAEIQISTAVLRGLLSDLRSCVVTGPGAPADCVRLLPFEECKL